MESHRSRGRQTVSTPTISRAISSSRSSRRAMSQQHSISGNTSVSWRANSRPRPEDAPVMMAVFIGICPLSAPWVSTRMLWMTTGVLGLSFQSVGTSEMRMASSTPSVT